MEALYELKEKLCDELEEYGAKKLDAGNLDVIDKLAHAIKNIDKIIDEYDDGYSEDGYMYDRTRPDGMHSYARGRRGTVRRDSMGRYSRDSKGMVHELKELMEDAPNESIKMDIKRIIQKVENM
jgi:hypothetical protein